LRLDGKAVVEHAVDAALASGASEVIVVLGHEASALRETLTDRPVKIVVNDRYQGGMSTSLRAGLSATVPGCAAALFLLADQPFVTPAIIDRLIDEFERTKALIVRPTIGGQAAHPVLMSSELFPELMAQTGDRGGREIIARHAERQKLVSLIEPEIGLDIDTEEDYREAIRATGKNKL